MHLAQDADADALLATEPLALLIGMLLDQQIPLEHAFAGPHTLRDRLGHDLDAREIADYDPDELAALFARPRAIHRYPNSMATRVQALCRQIVDTYDGDAGSVWTQAADGPDLLRRLRSLPGFGEQKARIFLALLGKQLGVRPAGWREAAGPYGEQGSYRSVADIVDSDSLAQVRSYKQQMKAAAKSKGS